MTTASRSLLQPGWIRTFVALLPAVFVVGLLGGCEQSATPNGTQPSTANAPAVAKEENPNGPAPVPTPDLSQVETAVQDTLKTERAKLDHVIATAKTSNTDLGSAYGAMGIAYDRYSLRNAAQVCYENAQLMSKKDHRWPFYLGFLHYKSGDLAPAIVSFEQSLALNASYFPTLVHLAEVRLERGEVDEAEKAFDQALSIHSTCARAIFGLGKVAAARQQWADAIKHYERAQQLAPKSDEVNYPLGLAYRHLKQTEKARELMSQRGNKKIPIQDPLLGALKTETVGWRRHQNLGTTQVQNGDIDKAETTFSKAIAAAPDAERFLPLSNRGACREMLAERARADGNTDLYWSKLGESRADFEASLKLNQSHALTWYNYGKVLALYGEDEGSVDAYTSSLKIKYEDLGAHMNLGNALRRLGRFEEAAEHYAQVVKMYPADESSRLALALTYMRTHEYDKAHEVLEESNKVLPESNRIGKTLARLLATQPRQVPQDLNRAIQLVKQISERERARGKKNTDLKLYITNAMALSHGGAFDRAKEVLEACLQAAERAKRQDIVQRIQSYLDLVENKKAITEPWPDDHPTLAPPSLKTTGPIPSKIKRPS